MFRTYGRWSAQGDCCPRGGGCRSSADGKGRKGATGTDGNRGEQGGPHRGTMAGRVWIETRGR
jgi:hypothetical protein